MNFFEAMILGVVEGLTEFLPISSTAHLTFTEYVLGIPETEFLKSFSIIIQVGAILSILFLYGKRFVQDFETNKKILSAFIPTAVIGFILYKLIKNYLIGNIIVSLFALGIGGGVIIIFERIFKNKKPENDLSIKDLSYKKAFFIGIGQSLSVIPGVSRSGASIFSGLFAGLSRKEAVEFSFLLALPTMLAATGYDFLKNYNIFNPDDLMVLLVGLFFSFIFGLIGIKFLKKIAEAKTLEGFGWYRIVFAVLFFFFFFK